MTLDLNQFLNSHKNTLLQIVKESDIPISKFKTLSEGRNFDIMIVGTPLVFKVKQSPQNFNDVSCQYSLFKSEFPLNNECIFVGVSYIEGELRRWLDDVVKKYFEFSSVPDEWSELSSIQPMISSATFTEADFEMFTIKEKEQIQDALLEFQRLLQEETSVLKDDLNQIKEKLEYLGNAVNRLNRFDWKGVALSTVIGIATNSSIDTNTGKTILDFFQQAFNSVISLLPPTT